MVDNTQDDFATVLRRLRRIAALTQEELAENSGLSTEGISALERGERRRPHARTVDLLIQGLGVEDEAADGLRAAARPPRRSRPAGAAGVRVPLRPRQLPAAPSRHVGRDPMIDRITRTLSASGSRQGPARVGLSGMGGIGKSSAALVAAHRVVEDYPDGQLYMDLRGQDPARAVTPLAALSFVLTALGVRDADIGTDVDQAAGLLRTLTHDARLLLVLDNAADAAQVAPLLPSGAGTGVLITSRAPLTGALDLEHEQLRPLDDREARAVLDRFVDPQRLDAEPESTAALVQACSGLPLALRLVGARLEARPTWSVKALAQQVVTDPGRLRALGEEDLDIGRTLLGSIDQLAGSADELDHDAATVMHVVSLLPRPVVSAVPIAAACGWPVHRAEAAIDRLVAVSLVEERSPGRYRVHDLIHAVAADRAVEESGPEQTARLRRRILEAYRSLCWHSRQLTRPDPDGMDPVTLTAGQEVLTEAVACVDVVAADVEQITALIRLQVEEDDAGALLAAQTVLGLSTYYLSRADSSGWQGLLELAVDRLPAGTDDERTWLSIDLALLNALQGEFDEAQAWAADALALAIPAQRHAAVSAAHSTRCLAHRRAGDTKAAAADSAAALEAAQASGRERVIAPVYRDLGLLRFELGERAEGLAAQEQALELYRRLRVPRGVGMALVNAGVMLREMGRMPRARTYLEEAVRVAHGVTDHALEAEALDELGYWHIVAGSPGRGLEVLTEGLAVVDERGSNSGEASIRRRLGLALDGLGRHNEADEHWSAALLLAERLGEPFVADELRRTLDVRES